MGDANSTGPYNVNLSYLVEGANLIAVKLYQQAIGSSDITLGYEILAVVDTLAGTGPGPQLSVSNNSQTERSLLPGRRALGARSTRAIA